MRRELKLTRADDGGGGGRAGAGSTDGGAHDVNDISMRAREPDAMRSTAMRPDAMRIDWRVLGRSGARSAAVPASAMTASGVKRRDTRAGSHVGTRDPCMRCVSAAGGAAEGLPLTQG